MRWMEEPVMVFDLETTSLDPKKDRIVKMAILKFQAGKPWREMEAWVSKFWSEVPMAPDAMMINRIEPAELEGLPSIEDKMESILDILSMGKIFMGYNILRFDAPFLEEALKRSGSSRKLPFTPKNVIDPFVFARALYDKARGWKLDQMAARLGARARTHDALDCTLKAAEVMVRMAVTHDLPPDLSGLTLLQERYIREWEERRKK